MGYIEQLRDKVGDEPLLLAKTTVAVLDEQRRILLIRRTSDGEWNVPGGFMELKESAEDAGRREVQEETGVEVGELGLLGVFSGERYFKKMDNGDPVYPVILNFLSKDIRRIAEPEDLDEAVDAKFFPLDRLPDETADLARQIIHLYGPAFF